MKTRTFLKSALGKVGISVSRIGSRKKRLLSHYGISHVLDVGANIGQFAQGLRTHVGYTGEIISFEPLSSAFELLERKARADPKWQTVNCALGDEDGPLQINISDNSVSSSFLSILPTCVAAAPDSKYVSRETVLVHTLDSVFGRYCTKSDNIYLKMDTQGFEKQVLDGGRNVLPHIDTVELELSLVPLYENQVLFSEMCEFLTQLGYSLVSIEPGFSDSRTGRLLQVDGIFHRY